jgi:octopine/nopaline transport system substrate-binding protein
MKALVATLLLLLAGCHAAAPSRDAGELVIGTEGAYPPWNFTRPDGTLAGFEPEYLPILCARLHRHCRMVAMDWDGMIGALQTGKIDLIADAVQITPERAQVLAFGRPYALTTGVIATLRGSSLATLGDGGVRMDLDAKGQALDAMTTRLRAGLAGKVIGVQLSGAFDGYLTQAIGPGVAIRYYRTMGERDLDLLNGRIDGTLEDESYIRPLIATRDGTVLTMAGPRLIGGAIGRGEALAFRPGDSALRAAFDRAIGDTLADGTVRRLGLKWFRMDASPAGAHGGR